MQPAILQESKRMSSKIERVPKSVHGCPDRKNDQGLWMVTWKVDGLTHHSRASNVWSGVKTRCSVGTMAHIKGPSYIGVTNGFTDFQEFAEWCNEQPGYMNRDHKGRICLSPATESIALMHAHLFRAGSTRCSLPQRLFAGRFQLAFHSIKAVESSARIATLVRE
jgi:hypothetical protein